MEPPLGRRLYLGHRAVHDVLDERMGERGASLWHWILLRQAAEHDGFEPAGARPRACTSSRRPWCATSTSWPHEGLVERRRDEQDRRIARVYRHRRRATAGCKSSTTSRRRSTPSCGPCSPSRRSRCSGETLMRIHDHFAEKKEERDANQR